MYTQKFQLDVVIREGAYTCVHMTTWAMSTLVVAAAASINRTLTVALGGVLL